MKWRSVKNDPPPIGKRFLGRWTSYENARDVRILRASWVDDSGHQFSEPEEWMAFDDLVAVEAESK